MVEFEMMYESFFVPLLLFLLSFSGLLFFFVIFPFINSGYLLTFLGGAIVLLIDSKFKQCVINDDNK